MFEKWICRSFFLVYDVCGLEGWVGKRVVNDVAPISPGSSRALQLLTCPRALYLQHKNEIQRRKSRNNDLMMSFSV